MRNVETALSLDLDGVVCWRPPFQTKAVRDYFKSGPDIYIPPPFIPVIPRELRRKIRNEPITRKKELIDLFLARTHFVFHGVKKTLLNLDDVDIYGNTGRPNKKAWVDLTLEKLKRAEILDKFTDILFRPNGYTTMLSKIAGVSELRELYRQVIHVDDNPEDALPIAARFPDVQVVIVQDLTTGLLFSRVEMEKFPNVRRVAVFKDVLKSLKK